MGFARWYVIDTEHPEFRAAWPQLVADARLIVDEVSARGISIRGGAGVGDPIVSVQYAEESVDGEVSIFERGAIWFNGDREARGGLRDLRHPAIKHPNEGMFTKTEELPYDLAVAAVMVRAKALAPAAVRLVPPGYDEIYDPSLDGGRPCWLISAWPPIGPSAVRARVRPAACSCAPARTAACGRPQPAGGERSEPPLMS